MKLAKDQAVEMRMRSVAKQFQKLDRVLTGDKTVGVIAITPESWPQYREEATGSNSGPMPSWPGWSSYPNIYLNSSAFDEPGKTSTLLGMLGLNYHELSHLMFTPRGFKKWLVREEGNKFGLAWNIMEDQRIESFFTALYEPAGKFFAETFVRFIMGDDESKWGQVFIWSYGRSFLPLELRQEFEARFARPDLIDEVKDIIDQYKALKIFDKSPVRSNAVKLTRRMVAVLDELNIRDNDIPDCDGGDQGQGEPSDDKQDDARKKERQRRSREDRTGEDQSNFWDEDDEDEDDDESDGDDTGDGDDAEGDESDSDSDDGGDSSDPGEDGESEDDSSDGGKSDDSDDDGDDSDSTADSDSVEDDPSDDGEGSNGDSDRDGDSDDGDGMSGDDGDGQSEDDDESASDDASDDGDSDGAGTSDQVESQFDDEELRDYLNDISEAIEQDEAVKDEVGRIQTAMNDNTDIDVIDFGRQSFDSIYPEPEEVQVVKTLTSDFQKLWAEAEPGWHYGSDVGKLNVSNVIQNPEDFDQWFDEWDEGREIDTGLEVVILNDLSISMAGKENLMASKALWMLKRSLDAVDAKVTVLGFHSWSVGLYDRNMKAESTIPVWRELGGSTQPLHGFGLAKTIFDITTLPNCLLIVITDGEWTTVWTSEEDYIEAIDAIPATKMYVGVGAALDTDNAEAQKHFHVTANVNHATDLIPLAQKTIHHLVASRLHTY